MGSCSSLKQMRPFLGHGDNFQKCVFIKYLHIFHRFKIRTFSYLRIRVLKRTTKNSTNITCVFKINFFQEDQVLSHNVSQCDRQCWDWFFLQVLQKKNIQILKVCGLWQNIDKKTPPDHCLSLKTNTLTIEIYL